MRFNLRAPSSFKARGRAKSPRRSNKHLGPEPHRLTYQDVAALEAKTQCSFAINTNTKIEITHDILAKERKVMPGEKTHREV